MMDKKMSIVVRNSLTASAIKADMEKRGINTNAEWMDTIIQNINMLPKFKYGDFVEDKISFFKGHVTAFENYYDQMPNRYLVEDEFNSRWICESRLRLYEAHESEVE